MYVLHAVLRESKESSAIPNNEIVHGIVYFCLLFIYLFKQQTLREWRAKAENEKNIWP